MSGQAQQVCLYIMYNYCTESDQGINKIGIIVIMSMCSHTDLLNNTDGGFWPLMQSFFPRSFQTSGLYTTIHIQLTLVQE